MRQPKTGERVERSSALFVRTPKVRRSGPVNVGRGEVGPARSPKRATAGLRRAVHAISTSRTARGARNQTFAPSRSAKTVEVPPSVDRAKHSPYLRAYAVILERFDWTGGEQYIPVAAALWQGRLVAYGFKRNIRAVLSAEVEL